MAINNSNNKDFSFLGKDFSSLKENLINYECACCGIGPIWQNKPMPLILDHINGVNNDNRLENLRFVCSNCDSQLSTYKSKNIKK